MEIAVVFYAFIPVLILSIGIVFRYIKRENYIKKENGNQLKEINRYVVGKFNINEYQKNVVDSYIAEQVRATVIENQKIKKSMNIN